MTRTCRRRLTIMALFALTGAAASLGAVASSARAADVTPETLTAAGWTCFPTPPGIVPPRISCANSGHGRPFPGNPDPAPTYTLLTFDPAGTFLGTVHLVRADLYQGQPCGASGDPYVFRGAIGYYECLRV